MPMPPRTWVTDDFVTAEFLNTDLYSYVPHNNHFPNGVLFHSMPPMMHAYVNASGLAAGSSSAGTSTGLSDTGTANHWGTTDNNETMYSGSNGPYQGLFTPRVQGADGGNTAGGGNYLCYSQLAWVPQTNANGYASASITSFVGAPDVHGGSVLPSTSIDQMPWALDLVQAVKQVSNTIDFTAQSICQDSSGNAFSIVSNPNYPGTTSRAGYVWCGSGSKNSPPLATGLPAPITNWSTASSANLFAGLTNPLRFLNNKPQLRASVNSNTGTVGAGQVALLWGTVDYDNYSGFNVGTGNYTVPVDGVYLVYTMAEFNDATVGQRRVGVQINGTLTLWGPAASSASGSKLIRPQMVRLLDLHAGDTVSTQVVTSGASGNVTNAGRMVLVWMSALATSGTPLTYTPPDVAFRWPAGVPGSALIGQFNQHAGQDLAFLFQRPYVLAYQSTIQSGLARNSLSQINCQNNTGRVHGSIGDNYGGWSGTNFNYTVKVPGWYLVVGATFQALSTPAPYSPSQSFHVINSASTDLGPFVASLQSCNATSGLVTGNDGLLFVYLWTGDTIYPEYGQYNGSTTYSTTVATTGAESHFGLVWVSE